MHAVRARVAHLVPTMTFTAKDSCLPPCAFHMYSDDDPTHLPLSHAPFLIMQHQCANMRRVFFLCSCSVQCDVTRSALAIGIKVLKPCLIGFHKFIVNQMLVRLHCKKPLKFSSKLTTFEREIIIENTIHVTILPATYSDVH